MVTAPSAHNRHVACPERGGRCDGRIHAPVVAVRPFGLAPAARWGQAQLNACPRKTQGEHQRPRCTFIDVFLRPPPEAKRIARDETDRLREHTRAELLRYEEARTTQVSGPSGAEYDLRVYSFLDTDDPRSDLFVQVRARPLGGRFYRAAKAGFVVDDESQVWHLGEVVGRLPSTRT
jgi:hypothetical protein